jgi:hypothetical protein
VSALSQAVSVLSVAIADKQSAIVTNSAQMTSINNALSNQISAANNFTSLVYAVLSDKISNLLSADTAISNAVSALSVVVSNRTSAIVANSAQMTSADNAISNAVSVLSVVVSNQGSALVANSAQMTSADNAISNTISVLSAALVSVVTTRQVTADDVRLKQISVAVVSNTLSLNVLSANVYTIGLVDDVTTFTISNTEVGRLTKVMLFFIADGTPRTVSWPATTRWANASAPTLTGTLSAVDYVELETFDGGTTWFGTRKGAAY